MSDSETLLIVVATEAERPRIDPAEDVEVLVCGVGKIGAALATAERLARGGVSDVVSFGVAGAFPSLGLAVGDVIMATAVAAIDEGRLNPDGFLRFEQMPVPGGEWRAVDETLRTLARSARGGGAQFARTHDAAATAHDGFATVHGRIATVSVCAGTTELAKSRGMTGALAEGMEGAAVAEAATRADVPFAELRGISNLCGPREGEPFDLAGAIANASVVLATLIEGWRTSVEEWRTSSEGGRATAAEEESDQ